MIFPRLLAGLLPSFLAASLSHAVIFDATADPNFNTMEPTGSLAGSGWQFEGQWGGFLGTPIAPNYFITAAHIGGAVGQTITFQGVEYTTDATFGDPGNSDLRIWRIAGSFPTYAPLYTAGNETGLSLVVIGRGTQRGEEVRSTPGNVLHGWMWGIGDGVQRWGTNVVSGFANIAAANDNKLLGADFNHIGGTEAHLSGGDSGGAVFVKDPADGIWKLAGINYAVSGPYYTDSAGAGAFNAALFNENGYYFSNGSAASGPGTFYATRISARLDFIQTTIVPEPGAAMLLLAGSAGIACRRKRNRNAESDIPCDGYIWTDRGLLVSVVDCLPVTFPQITTAAKSLQIIEDRCTTKGNR